MPRHLTTNDISSTNMVLPNQIGVANGVAGLDGTGKVPLAQLPTIATGSVTSVNGQTGIVNLTAAQVNAVPSSSVGMANGVASLDATGHIPSAQLPTNFVLTSQIGAVSGVAGLDGNAKVPMAQLYTNVANGVPQLDGTGLMQSAQSLIKSVNGFTGVVNLTAANVNAIATSALGAASGVAQLNSSSKVPIGQVPDLSSLYLVAPGATAGGPGQLYTSTGAGSNSAQWSAPLAYTAANQATRPVAPPTGSFVTQTDINAGFVYGGSQWFRINADIGIPKYASLAAVNADFPSPADGQHVYRTDLHQTFWYNGQTSKWLPLSQGVWTAYNPTWTTTTGSHTPSIGNGSITGRYCQVGNKVDYVINFQAGSTTNYNSGNANDNWVFSLPVAMSASWPLGTGPGFPIGYGNISPDGSSGHSTLRASSNTSTSICLLLTSANPFATAATNTGLIDAVTPTTMTTSALLGIAGSYEAA